MSKSQINIWMSIKKIKEFHKKNEKARPALQMTKRMVNLSDSIDRIDLI
jgi:hypothetical protein